jgi:rhodanese-related sulfurtransferase
MDGEMDNFKTLKITIYRTIILVLIAIAGGVAFNQFSPKGLKLITPFHRVNIGDQHLKIPIFLSRKLYKQQSLNLGSHQPLEFRLNEAYEHYQNRSALFIDARTSAEYNEGHIPQAVSIPLEAFDYQTPILADFPMNQMMITYCEGESCSESIDLAVHLNEIGFSDVHIFIGGWEQWQAAGYPVNEGDQP